MTHIPSSRHRQPRAGPRRDLGCRGTLPDPPEAQIPEEKKGKKRKRGNFLCDVTRAPTAACRKTFWEAVTVTQTGTRRTLEEDGL